MSEAEVAEAHILDSWHRNARAWTEAVRAGAIDTRRLVTDQAIVEAVRSRSPKTVLDLGCGEGWLARALAREGVEVSGWDAVGALVEEARRAGGGTFHTGSYENLAAEDLTAGGPPAFRADVVVCNFALFGDESVVALFSAVPRLLTSGGSFIVQTLHPLVACGDAPYRDGWRPGSWQGFSSQFCDPAPWYFRTLQSWSRLFADQGFRLLELREPLHPNTGRPASVIFIASPG